MKPRQLWLVCALAAVILAAGVSPLMAWDYRGHAAPGTSSKPFPVYSATDTYCEVWFKWDAPCTLSLEVWQNGTFLKTYDLSTGQYLILKGGGTFNIKVVAEEGSCNWEATIAELFSGGPYKGGYGGPLIGGGSSAGTTINNPGGTTTGGGTKPGGGSVTDLEGETPRGTADCAGLIFDRVTLSEAGGEIVYVQITPDCVPQMYCFTVAPGLLAEIKDANFKSAGYNCATGAKIDDPGLIVTEGCCTDKVVYSCGKDKNGKWWSSGRNQFGPGTYTLQPAGGRNYTCKVEFLIY
jgi:hypothetical protein